MVELHLSGTPAEIGLARGTALKYAIQLAVEHWMAGHTYQYSVEKAREYGRRMAADMAGRCAELLEEITATARAAEIDEEEMYAYVFRVWNAFSEHPATRACYNMSFTDPVRGLVVAGVLEDGPPFYLLEHITPAAGYPLYAVNWAGMTWAVRSMNATGLAIGQASSFAGTRFRQGERQLPFDLYARAHHAERVAVQHAATVAEAVEILRSFQCTSTYMIGDSSGRVVILEVCGDLYAVREPDTDGLLVGGGFQAVELIRALLEEGVAHDWEEEARLSRGVLTALRAAGERRSVEWMMAYLRGEKADGGWCHDGLQAATIACPLTRELWVSGYRPCAAGFQKYRVDA